MKIFFFFLSVFLIFSASTKEEKKSDHLEKILDDGASCKKKESDKLYVTECFADKKYWSCSTGICYPKEYRELLLKKNEKCLKKEGEEKDICFESIKLTLIYEYAIGSFCTSRSQEEKCEKENKKWNCLLKECITPKELEDFSYAVLSCREEKSLRRESKCRRTQRKILKERRKEKIEAELKRNKNLAEFEKSKKLKLILKESAGHKIGIYLDKSKEQNKNQIEEDSSLSIFDLISNSYVNFIERTQKRD